MVQHKLFYNEDIRKIDFNNPTSKIKDKLLLFSLSRYVFLLQLFTSFR